MNKIKIRITPKIIQEVKKIVVDKIKPLKIILFGSYSHGKPSQESDLDLLIITHSNLPRYKRAKEIRLALSHYLFQKDILIYTPEEVEEWENVPQAFIATAINKGRVIYEKQS